ncbi:Protein CBG02437 [Caenorhabditis briggsae]|uniref:Protein CBG02437 n=1 Tax=Caenorhabditis briggsae TaxID=6238 RepID=A8WUB7_CAEBR|nr:Protein CBG02437 [Caenorhabditis briggsae]CAP24079.2 Protein CBG02437 [Caenorhabditis briggsae]
MISVFHFLKHFAELSVKPLVREMDENAKLDKNLLEEAFRLKLMGLEVDEEYGGSRGSFFDVALTVEEISKVDPAVALTIHLQNALIAPMLSNYGSEEQKEHYLKRVCTDSIESFALSETISGSDAFAMKTTATKDGDDFVINGSKLGISNAPIADFFLVLANAEPEKGHRGITCFLVDRNQTGVVVGKKDQNLGMRARTTRYKYAIDILNASRILIGAQMVGLAQGCFDQSIPYLRERKQFGKRLIDFQIASKTSKQCIKWLGGIGFTKDFPAEKFYRDSAVGGIYEGTSNIQLNTIAKFIDNEYKN